MHGATNNETAAEMANLDPADERLQLSLIVIHAVFLR
jgi:hypothetical protein